MSFHPIQVISLSLRIFITFSFHTAGERQTVQATVDQVTIITSSRSSSARSTWIRCLVRKVTMDICLIKIRYPSPDNTVLPGHTAENPHKMPWLSDHFPQRSVEKLPEKPVGKMSFLESGIRKRTIPGFFSCLMITQNRPVHIMVVRMHPSFSLSSLN